MALAFEWMVAGRYLRARRQEGFISVIAGFSFLGIALGVATLIIVLSVMNGFRAELLGRILGINGHVLVQGASGGLDHYSGLAAALGRIAGVDHASPIIEGQVMAIANGQASGALVRGMAPEDLRRHALVAANIAQGSLADFSGTDVVAIGDRLAQRLGVSAGDLVTLISAQGTATALGTVPRGRAYRVAATFDVGMYEYDSTFVFLPLEAAQVFFRLPGQAEAIEVMLADPDSVERLRPLLFEALGPGVTLVDWRQINAHYFMALQVERNVMFLILTLIILVAAFNIVSSLIMLVKDKGRDIAILRTMGATRGMVMRIFFYAGASIGVAGTAAGFGLGLVFADNIQALREWLQSLSGTDLFAAEIYFLSRLPAKVDPGEVGMVVAMGLALSFLATIYPSWRAARLDPVAALRYE
ncbi:MAG: lipoprotein-releasing ABC transporter permease subunit [Alphaproteobacteria bacterium]|nr:lipoprotein-releasing ABC transporter permease subunit [Alphaproteobacteria bacterium]